MEKPSLWIVSYILGLDGIGLIVLATRNKYLRLAAAQGAIQLTVSVTSLLLLPSISINIKLYWMVGLLLALAARYILHVVLAKRGAVMGGGFLENVYFSPELHAYFFIGAMIYYLAFDRFTWLPFWGRMCWGFAFGTSTVLLWLLGGVGLMSLRLGRKLVFAVRLSILCGLVALAIGMWRAIE